MSEDNSFHAAWERAWCRYCNNPALDGECSACYCQHAEEESAWNAFMDPASVEGRARDAVADQKAAWLAGQTRAPGWAVAS
jgi:hypothetical protein